MIPGPEELPRWVVNAIAVAILVVPTVGIMCIAKALFWAFKDGSVLTEIKRNTRRKP